MTERASFYRKIAYLSGIALIAIFLYWLSTPATANSEGGELAKLREQYGLGQSNLGDVDPASETMRFLTLGLRGVAVTLLWHKADQSKMKEDWTNLTATLNQLAKLQPNFITFWKYQAWNVAYNVSVEFDDYRDRYYYVREGIKFLMEGERYNHNHPQILSELGWFIGQKIGRADEKAQYRRLFKEDDDFHPADLPPDQRDNWLVSKNWYLRAIDAVEVEGKSLGTKSPREFYSNPAKSQINYAEAIEDEGQFDKARLAWALGGQEWKAFGRRPIRHVFGDMLYLGEEPRLQEKVDSLQAQLDAIRPDAREQVKKERLDALTPEERDLYAIGLEVAEPDDRARWYAVQEKVEVTDRDVAERIVRDVPEQSQVVAKLLEDLNTAQRLLHYTQSYKETANFDFWQQRCDYEQTENAVAARQSMFLAYQAAQRAELVEAKDLYEQGFAKWQLVLDEFPELRNEDIIFGDHIVESTKRYRDVLDQLTLSLDEKYPFWDVLEKGDQDQIFTEDIARHKQALDAATK